MNGTMCDRCGKVYEKKSISETQYETGQWQYIHTVASVRMERRGHTYCYNDIQQKKLKRMDLCENCRKDFEKFMSEVSESVESNR